LAEIGAANVTERGIERMSAKRTRTVTVRPGRDLARSRRSYPHGGEAWAKRPAPQPLSCPDL